MTASSVVLGQSAVVSVNGARLERAHTVSVDLAAGLPAIALLRFPDPAQDAVTAAHLRVGAPVTVQLNDVGNTALVPLFTGEVTALEYEYDGRGATVVARCADKLHRLTRGRRTRSWTQTTDAAVARAVLGGAGLTPGVLEGAKLVHDHVAQLATTDWEFLAARAAAAGQQISLTNGRVDIRVPPPNGTGTPIDLAVGREIDQLRIRLTAAAQVAAVTTAGWDPQQARAVKGRAGAPRGTGPTTSGPARLASPFRPPPVHEGSPSLTSVAEANARAEALAAAVADAHVELDGWVDGDPHLVPGRPIRVRGAGKTYDGTYVLSRVQHVVDRDGYRTHIEVSGSEDRRLRPLAGGGGGGGGAGGSGNLPVPGVTIGVVTDIKDPRRQGRVKVKFPWLSDDYATDWVRVVGAGGGRAHGLVVLPEVNDEVLVAFAHGDTRQPYVIGGLWSGRAAPPLPARLVDPGSGRVGTRTLMSREGHRVTLSDELGRGGVEIATGDGRLTMTMATATTKVTLSSLGAVLVEGLGEVTVSAKQKLVLEGLGGVEIKGATVQVTGLSQVSVLAPIIKLN